MATNNMYPDARPAPLRIFPKRPNRDSRPETPATRCNTLAKLPSQPVFGNADTSEHDTFQISKACQSLNSPISPLFSPVSPQDNSMNRPGSQSLDFSSLFMKSPILRQELESCICQHICTATSQPVSISSSSELDQSDTSSIFSGYTSVYSR